MFVIFASFSDCDNYDDGDDDIEMDDDENDVDMKTYNVKQRIHPYFSNCLSNSGC